jgi:hypothetical protein
MLPAEPEEQGEEEATLKSTLIMGFLMALLGVAIVWKAINLGYSVLSGVLTALGLYAIYGITWAVMRYMAPGR